ncbi:hypothetical protein [Agromyces sp. NPDC060279]|uniref:hypothetical protein n=1 Tax=Agromyces sp. NPDC060279 TaxID=3347092 RepID=UPI003651E6C1
MKRNGTAMLVALALVTGGVSAAVAPAPPAQAATAGCAAALVGKTPPGLFAWDLVPGPIVAHLTQIQPSDRVLLQQKTSSGWTTRATLTNPDRYPKIRAKAGKGTVWRVLVQRGPTPDGYCATYKFGPVTKKTRATL